MSFALTTPCFVVAVPMDHVKAVSNASSPGCCAMVAVHLGAGSKTFADGPCSVSVTSEVCPPGSLGADCSVNDVKQKRQALRDTPEVCVPI